MLDKVVLNNFRGLNRVSDRLNMSPEFAWNIYNGYIKKDIKSGLGIISQRDGCSKYNSVAFTGTCKYIFEAKWNGGARDVIIRAGTRWAKFNGTTTFADLDTGRTDGVRGQAVMFMNELIMVDGGVPRKCTAAYSVSNLSTDANMPQDSTAVHVHQHKVWLNSSSFPMKAYFCKSDSANSASSWTGTTDAGVLDFSAILPHGDTLVGFKTFGEAFLIFFFKRYAVVFNCGTDPTQFSLQQIIPLNAVSPHAISVIGNDLAVCSQEGVNSFKSSLANQDLDIDDLSKYIAPLYREYVNPLTDQTVISSEFSHALNHLYICIPGSTHNIFVYSLDIKNFVGVWSGYDCHSIVELQDGTMLVGGDGYVFEMNVGSNDDGELIPWSYEFPYLYANSPDDNKALRQIEGIILHDGSPILNIEYNYATDDSSSYTPIQLSFTSSGVLWDSDDAEWDVASWSGGNAERFLTSNVKGRGKQFSISLSTSTLDSHIEIPYIILRYKREGIKVR